MSTTPSRAAPIIDRAPLPLVEVEGSEHIVIHVNSAFCTLLGKSRAELLGKQFCEIAPGANACVPLLDQVYQTGRAVTQALIDPHDGNGTAWLYAMWPALDPDDQAERVIIGLTKVSNPHQHVTDMNEALLIAGLRAQESKETAEDLATNLEAEIVERKRAEQKLREAIERLAVTDRNKDEFLAMLAHELRNPLAPIKNAAEILRMSGSKDATIVRAQTIIERQADHLAKLVDELLDLSRVQKGKIRLDRVHVDLGAAVLNAVDSCEEVIKTHHHTVTTDLPAAPVHIDADRTRIDQVLVNLITNAAKYTAPGGAIHITVRRELEMAVVRIRDTGIGLAPESLPHVFELFSQVEQSLARSQGGLGLGLKLVKELVELHGGEVEARSEGLGKGSEFIVRLPALKTSEPAAVSEAPAPAVIAGRKRILVVDDAADNRETMEMLLTKYGHSVEVAEDGEEAVEKALEGRPDVAFVDIGLPKLDGYEVAKEIRRRPGGDRIVLIALSGYGQPEDKRMALEAGFDAHLTKPVRSGIFKQLLSELEKFKR
jgi:signal transduction histidine kinase